MASSNQQHAAAALCNGDTENKKPSNHARRRIVFNLISLSLLHPLVACGKSGKPMKNEIGIDVVLYSFLDRPILDIYLNGEDLGVASKYGSTSVVTGVTVPMGEQKLTWRLDGPPGTARNGDTVKMKNKVILQASAIPANATYMGVYIYPDDTVEFTFTEYMPRNSVRGEAIFEELKKNGRR
jgi:hypothetical protein